jgi:hypothetical protein
MFLFIPFCSLGNIDTSNILTSEYVFYILLYVEVMMSLRAFWGTVKYEEGVGVFIQQAYVQGKLHT